MFYAKGSQLLIIIILSVMAAETTNRQMIVRWKNGDLYFRTDSVSPAREIQEQNFWEGHGYKVEWQPIGQEQSNGQ